MAGVLWPIIDRILPTLVRFAPEKLRSAPQYLHARKMHAGIAVEALKRKPPPACVEFPLVTGIGSFV